MPSKLRAGGTFQFILADDREDGASPQYEIKVLSYGESDQLRELRKQFIAETDPAKRQQIVELMLAMTVQRCLIPGYESIPFAEYLTELECWELINAASEGAALTNDQRKKFVSQSKSGTDCCVSDAAETSAATT